MDPIDLRIASVREARNADRRFCFEIVTPNFTRVYQATSEEDMKSWIYTINNALQSAVEGNKNSGPVLDSPSGTGRKDFASALTGKSLSQRSHNISRHPVGRHATVGERPANRPAPDASNEGSQKLLQMLRDADIANKFCADCNSESKVDWVSINLGVIICIECSGIHRSLGTHVSKVRSLTLDPNAFTPDVIEILLTLGNRNANKVWEATLDETASPKPTAQATRDQRLRFITAKYADRAYIEPLSPQRSHFSTPDETLLAAIKKNAIAEVAYALALHANPDVLDRSRSTHAVFLALAAADPASPSPLPGEPTSRNNTARKPFAVAELLLLNGAELPIAPPPIPLSRAGRDYLEAKVDQKAGRRATPALGPSMSVPMPGSTITAVPAQPGDDSGSGVGIGGDTLTALPTIAEPGRSPGERRKRMSSGGKLTKPGGAGVG
jgi:Arf-GAP with SH3 domain, ANK repeat and PH domain-containing protein